MNRKNIEELCEDMLNENFVKLFHPIHFVQRICGLLRVNIKYKFVTGPSGIYQCYSVLLSLLSILSNVDMALHYWTVFGPTLDFVYKLLIMMHITSNMILSWQNNFNNGYLNSQLYVKLQNIDRKISLHRSEYINGKCAVATLVLTVILTILGITWVFTCNYCIMQEFNFVTIVGQLYGLGCYTELVLFSYIIYYIGIRVAYINSLLEDKPTTVHVFRILGKGILMVSECKQPDGTVGGEMVVGVHSILEVLNDLLKLYQLPVSGPKRGPNKFPVISNTSFAISVLDSKRCQQTKPPNITKMQQHKLPYLGSKSRCSSGKLEIPIDILIHQLLLLFFPNVT